MLRAVLLALDDSTEGRAAIDLGIRWAKDHGAGLTGVAIINEAALHKTEAVPIGGAAFKDEADNAAVQSAQSRAQEVIEDFRQRCRSSGIKPEDMEMVTASPEYLVQEAQRHDVLLMGRNSDFVYGVRDRQSPVLEEVVRNAPRPVVALPDKLQPDGPTLVAYDGSLQAARALQALVAAGLASQTRVTIMTAHDRSADDADESANRARDYLARHEIAAETRLTAGMDNVEEAILNEADRMRAGLIVMGAYGHHSLREFLFGSVTRKVVAQAPVPVFLSH